VLSRKGKISENAIKLILTWRHSGFNLHCGPRIHNPAPRRPWRNWPDTSSRPPFPTRE